MFGVYCFQGKIYLLNGFIDCVFDIFVGLGYIIFIGLEMESDYYNFEVLNILLDYLVRDMQDIFYLVDGNLMWIYIFLVQI